MAQELKSGENLQDDFNFLRIDTTFHDVTLVCAGGVRMRACRGVLAARCKVLRTKLNPQPEVFPKAIDMGKISSRALEVVLAFIHTEAIDVVMSPEICVEAYWAAVDLGLSKLQRMIIKRLDWKTIQDFSVASSLLNKAVAELPPFESDAGMYEILLKPFCTPALAIGQLNDLSKQALELFLKQTRAPETQFETSEHVLLLCMIEWVWAQDERPPPATERHTVLKRLGSDIGDGTDTNDVKITLTSELARGSLQLMLRYMDLTLICPHRLKSIAGAIGLFADTSPLFVAGLHHACTNTKCPPGHPSKIRGKSEIVSNFQWDRSKIGTGLVVSADGLVVELPGSSVNLYRTARLGTLFVANTRACDFDIVFESVGLHNSKPHALLGFVVENFKSFDSHMPSDYCLSSYDESCNLNSSAKFGKPLRSGDIVTFHLNMQDRTCSLSINGTSYGVAWRNLPEKVYPAVTLCQNGRCRLRPRT